MVPTGWTYYQISLTAMLQIPEFRCDFSLKRIVQFESRILHMKLGWGCCHISVLVTICWIHVWKKATMIYMTPKPEPTLFANVYFVNDDLPVLLIWSFWYDLSYSIFLNFPLFRVGPVLLLYCIIDVPIMPVAFNYWSYWKSRACKGCGFSVEFNKLCWVL